MVLYTLGNLGGEGRGMVPAITKRQAAPGCYNIPSVLGGRLCYIAT